MDRLPRVPLLATLLAVTAATGEAVPSQTDPDVSFTIAETSVVEGATVVSVDVTLSAAATADVTIPYTVGGSADGADATVPAGPLVIGTGQSAGVIDVTILDDGDSEGVERVVLTLGAPTGGQLGAITEHAVVIDDDEAAATLDFDLAAQDASEGDGTVSVTVTLSDARTEEARVSFTQTGTATPGGVDFDVAPASPIVIPAGATTVSVDVSLVADALDEDDEDVVLTMLLPVNCDLGSTTQHTLTILDDDDPPTVGFSNPASSVTEQGAPLSVTVDLSAASSFDVTVPVSAAGTATDGVDYSFTPQSLVIAAGELQGEIILTPADDSDVEGTESVTLTLGTPTQAGLGVITSHDVVLIDDDASDPLVEFASAATSADEDAGSVAVLVQASDYAAQPIVVDLLRGGSATEGVDYDLPVPSVTIPVGALSASVVIGLIDDTDNEGDETIDLSFGTVTGALPGTQVGHIVTILDQDGPPTVDFAVDMSTADEGAGTVLVDVNLSHAAAVDVTIPVLVSGTATAGAVDVEVTPDPLVILAGDTAGQFSVAITADDLFERDETVQLDLGTITGADAGTIVSHVLTITNDDDPPAAEFTMFRTVVAEASGGFDVRVVLDAPSGLDATIPFSVTGNAAGIDDISYVPDPLVIPAGQTFVDLPVGLVMDRVPELNDRVIFTLEAPTDATLGTITTLLVGIEDGNYGGQVAIAPPLTASLTEINFPQTRVGEVTAPETVFLSNLHSTPVTLLDVDTFGSHQSDFEYVFPGGLPQVVAPGQSIAVEVSFRPKTRGERRSSFRSRQAGQAAAPPRIEMLGVAVGPTGAEIRMDTTETGWVSPTREHWSAEYGSVNGFVTEFDRSITGTELDELYQTVRFGTDFGYQLELPNGAYEVVLRSFEPVKTAVGERVMDIEVEGQLVLDDLDLFEEVGRDTAWTSDPIVTDVIDGILDLQFTSVVSNALVSAIEVRSIPVLSTQVSDLAFGTVDQGTSLSVNVDIQNDGLHTGTLDRLTFRVDSIGNGVDFSIEYDSIVYTGGVQTVVRSPNIPLPPGITTIPVTFSPTAHEEHDIALEFESTETGDLFEIRATGIGGAEAGWGFLHPVPDSDPSFVVDYDQDGTETVALLGAESHTHEPGHTLTTYDWTVDGLPVASTVDTLHTFSIGSSVVALTIGDDNQPQQTATDTRTITVHPVNSVPGALVKYYDGSVIGELTLLDAVPGRPDFIGRSAGLTVQPGNGTVGDSLFTERVMLTLQASFELAVPRNLDVVATGGADHRLFVNGAPVTGTLALGAGPHSIEARFAVTSLADMPVSVGFFEGGQAVTDIEAGLVHDEQGVPPVIHTMPTIGTDLGGNRIEIRGFGFFPEPSTVVHWGTTDIPASQFDKWSGELIVLTTPPGTGMIQVTVETPQGISNAVDFAYSPSGPIPIRFDLLTDREVSIPDVTSATWGPDGKLYVSQLTGEIHVISYDDTWSVTSIESKTGVSGLTNHDVLSLAFNPYDVYDDQDPSSLKLYVGHGEQFQNGGGAFTGPSYFTGQVSILSGPDFDSPQPVITQLPVSNHDHAIDGMTFDENGDLLVSVGGNTNAGVQFPLLGDVPESPYSGAILRARLSKPGFNGTILYEDTATGVLVDDQVFGEQVDVADGVDIEVYASGMRHAYDLVLHTNGYIYATDNGPNSGYGPASTSLTTDAGPVHPYEDDELNLIEPGMYYGSANRNRGRYDERQTLYHPPGDASIPGVYRRPLTVLDSSTNGIDEYRATAFNSGMRGNLLAMKWNFGVYRVELTGDGRGYLSKTLYQDTSNQAHLPNKGLDVLTGPGGAIIAIDYIQGKVRVQVPNDISALGLTPYDISPWRVPAGGGQPFVIGGLGFGTSLAQVSVTIGGVPATLTSVSDTRIRGVYPPSASGADTDMLDVVVTVGQSQRTLESAARYMPVSPGLGRGLWRDGVSVPVPLGEVTTVVVDGILYVFGQGDARTFAFDIAAGNWNANLAQRQFAGNHHGAEVLDGKIYLLGGLDNGSAGQVQIYDIANDSWSLGAPMPWNGGSCVTALIDGLMYVGGGNLQGAGTAANFASYDPVADAWTSLGAMPTGVNHAASGTDGSKLYVFGGRQGMNVPQPGFDEVQVYDPVSNTWETSTAGDVAAMPLPRGGTGRALFVQGEFYVMGGEDDVNAFDEVQVYDPVTDSWRTDRPLPTPRHGIFPALHEGRVFVVGGGIVAGFSSSDVAEIFSPR